ncbi:MAG: DegT/DnrJ/EryC1/StrS family aminotransferase [Armatimonadetes bacterium]|nr:DegT/DnrJ/EryC1/StrS family aminotransferase [Armatimonadota bacterium]
MSNADKLALLGGTPVRSTPLGGRNRYTGKDALDNLRQVLEGGHMTRVGGTWVQRLEQEFAAFYGAGHCTASTSGTSAIHVAVGALNPEPGDEIIAAPITDLGTIIPILAQNAIPVFADVQRATFNLDPADLERRITPRTRAIIPVHLGGHPCDLAEILAVTERHGLVVIEDCSQAYCATYQGRRVGTIGKVGCFSMQQSKHFTTGQGGLTITDDPDWALRIKRFADKGMPRYSAAGARDYLSFGFNYEMSELHGAVAVAELPYVEGVCSRRTALGERLTSLIADCPGVHPQAVREGNHSTYWFYALRAVPEETGIHASKFAQALSAEGIGCGWQYIGKPIFMYEAVRRKRVYGESDFPFSLQDPAHAVRYEEGECPVCEQALDEMITIGLHEDYTEQDVEDIAAALHKVAAGAAQLAAA